MTTNNWSPVIPYSTYISRVLISRIPQIWKCSRNYFNKNLTLNHFNFELATDWWRKRWLYFNIPNKVDGTIQGPSYLIHAVLQLSAAGAKVVGGTYLKISAEKAEIGQRAAVQQSTEIFQWNFQKQLFAKNLDAQNISAIR